MSADSAHDFSIGSAQGSRSVAMGGSVTPREEPQSRLLTPRDHMVCRSLTPRETCVHFPASPSSETAAVTPRNAGCNNNKTPRKAGTPRTLFGSSSIDARTKTYTCKRILTHAGNMLAVPHETCTPPKPPSCKMDSVSVNHYDYSASNIAMTSCGAKQKPLIPYKPNAPRSRLQQVHPVKVWRNQSQIVFGNSAMDVRRFVTNHKNYHRGFSGVLSSNTAITAQKTRWFHHLQVL